MNIVILLFMSLRHFTVWEFSARKTLNLGKVVEKFVLVNHEKFAVRFISLIRIVNVFLND